MITRGRNFVETSRICLGLLILAVVMVGCSPARGQSLADCPAINGPCASYPWVDQIVGPAGEAKLLEYLRIFGHVSLHAHYYDSQERFLVRVDKLRPGLPVCLALSPYGPKLEPEPWTDPDTQMVYKKRPVWAADTDTGKAVADNGKVLAMWDERLAGRKVTLLVDFERWNLDGELDPRAPGALRDRWNALVGQVSAQFPKLERLIIYGWGDRWFQSSQNTASAIFGYWKPTQYWPADFTATLNSGLVSELGPVCYYGATAEGRAWTALRLNRVRMDAPSRRPWAHVQIVGQWPLQGSFRRGVNWSEADMEALGATFRASEAVPVFWGDVGSDTFAAQLPAFVRGFNGRP